MIEALGDPFRVNTYTDNTQLNTNTTTLADGSFVVIWISNGQDGSGYGVYGQRYSVTGAALGDEFRVNTTTVDSQYTHRYYTNENNMPVAALPDGGFVVVWSSSGQDGSGWGVFGQRFDSDGAPTGDEFQVNDYTNSSQLYARVTTLTDGGYVVTWVCNTQDGSGYGVYGQRYAEDGTTVRDEFQINTYSAGNQSRQVVQPLSDGRFVVLWESYLQDGSGYGVYGQLFSSNATAVGTEFRVNTHTTDYQNFIQITELEDGGFVATWSSSGGDGNGYGVSGQRYDANGTAVGTEFQVNTHTVDNQSDADIAGLSDGGFVVAWNSFNQDGSGWGIFAQRFNTDGTAAGDEFMVNSTTSDHQYAAQIVVLSNGGFAIVWESRSSLHEELLGQVYDASGETVGSEFQITDPGTGSGAWRVDGHRLTALPNGGFAVNWTRRHYDQDGILQTDVFARVYADPTTINADPTGDVTIVGDALEGALLTADVSTLDDEDGLGDLSYQWLRDGADIVGATSATYTPDLDDLDAEISVRVSYVDDEGNEEAVTSAATDPIQVENPVRGTDASETLTGSDAGDTFFASDGNDTIDAGPGNDRMIYSGTAPDYVISFAQDGNSILVADATPETEDQGTDTILSGLETILFADKSSARINWDNGIVMVRDPGGNRVSELFHDVSGTKSWQTRFKEYNSDGRLTESFLQYDDGTTLTTQFGYIDGTRRTKLMTDGADSQSRKLWSTLSTSYDENGKQSLIAYVFDDGTTLSKTFTYANGVLSTKISTDGQGAQSRKFWDTIVKTFDEDGNTAAVDTTYDDGTTNSINYTYENGVLIKRVETDGHCDMSRSPWSRNEWTYDSNGVLIEKIEVMDNGDQTTWTYVDGVIRTRRFDDFSNSADYAYKTWHYDEAGVFINKIRHEETSSSVLPLSFGKTFEGLGSRHSSGVSVSSAGDVNGDGIDDFLIGTTGIAGGKGATYVVFGTADGYHEFCSLSELDGTNGFVVNGIDVQDYSGRSVANAGDVNGDGIDDILIGASHASGQKGNTFVVFGTDEGFGASIELSDLDGSNGFVLRGIDRSELSGQAVSSAGDINGDGIDDILIGAPSADIAGFRDDGSNIVHTSAGRSYVVFGSDEGFRSTIFLSSLDGTNGFALEGTSYHAKSGQSVSSAGDINGDGFDDILIGAWGAKSSGITTGLTYVVFGTDQGFSQKILVSDLDGTAGFVVHGAGSGHASGIGVSSAGDLNGDGIDDFVIGSKNASVVDASGTTFTAGKTHVVFGSESGFPADLYLADLDGTDGFVLNGVDAYDSSGSPVSSAGDVNGDGIDDLLIGAFRADPGGKSYAGETYIVFGSDDGFDASVDLADLDGTDGFVFKGINANDASGRSISAAGDVNDDGFGDILISASQANDYAGETYLIYGGANILDRFDAADGTRDAQIELSLLAERPMDYDLVT